MVDPVKAWHEEHVYFGRMLALLRKEIDVFAAGESPNYALMLDIITYLREYSDQVHHPREDAVFHRLAQYRPDLALSVSQLHQEHRLIANAGETLRRLLEQAAGDAMVSRSEIEIAAATYLVCYGNHIAKEEQDILPLAQQTLVDSDWRAATQAAPHRPDPVFGDNPAVQFSGLRRRIAAEAD